MIAYCGLACHSCAIYLATREQEPKKKRQMRAEIARKINDIYKHEFEAEDVTDCDGCLMEAGRLFSGCHKCEIRKCARGKVIENCAYCGEYPCKQLKKFFDSEPDAKARLDAIRNTL